MENSVPTYEPVYPNQETTRVLSRDQDNPLQELREHTNPAKLTHDILRYQNILISLARQRTEQLTIKTEQAQRKHKNKLENSIKIRTA